MIEAMILELGPWSWLVLGLILLAGELVVPGIFLIWIGIAAIIVGAISLLIWDAGFWTWQVQVLVFLALAIAAALLGRRFMHKQDFSDQPLLNRRGEQLIGKTATLETAIENGRGRIRIDDTIWRVAGPDLEAGTKVRISGVIDATLTVEKAGGDAV